MASGSDKAPDQPRQLSADDFVADTFLANILGFALTQNSKSMANLGGSATQAQVWNLLIFFCRGPVQSNFEDSYGHSVCSSYSSHCGSSPKASLV